MDLEATLLYLCHAIGRAYCPDERPRGREQKRASGRKDSSLVEVV